MGLEARLRVVPRVVALTLHSHVPRASRLDLQDHCGLAVTPEPVRERTVGVQRDAVHAVPGQDADDHDGERDEHVLGEDDWLAQPGHSRATAPWQCEAEQVFRLASRDLGS